MVKTSSDHAHNSEEEIDLEVTSSLAMLEPDHSTLAL